MLEEHFGWLEKSIRANKAPEGINPAFAIAIFGISFLSGNALYKTYSEAFLVREIRQTGTGNTGGGGCGGCGG